jgi:nucleoside-triphosphatase
MGSVDHRGMATIILIEGRPGSGKTTVAKHTAELLRKTAVPLSGFITEEMRKEGERVGFTVQTLSGNRAVLAHVNLPGPPRVAKYGVDLDAFERVALPALQLRGREGVVIIDELGKMELASRAFQDAVRKLLQTDISVIATVHVHPHPFTDALKRRPEVEITRVNAGTRDALPAELARRFG